MECETCLDTKEVLLEGVDHVGELVQSHEPCECTLKEEPDKGLIAQLSESIEEADFFTPMQLKKTL